jgi:hypothetical protein
LRNIQLRAVSLAATVLALLPALSAQKSKMPLSAPLPPQVYLAHKVFISNGGGESFETVFDQLVFNGGPDRPYNQFYAAMRDWLGSPPSNSGMVVEKPALVLSPSDADLVLEIS